jgi:hypothetical protein
MNLKHVLMALRNQIEEYHGDDALNFKRVKIYKTELNNLLSDSISDYISFTSRRNHFKAMIGKVRSALSLVSLIQDLTDNFEKHFSQEIAHFTTSSAFIAIDVIAKR